MRPCFTGRREELIDSLPEWARGTLRQVRDLLGEGLHARDEDETERHRLIEDLTERIKLLHEAAHPHDENRKLVNHLYNNRDWPLTFLADPALDATRLAGPARSAAHHRDPQGLRRQP